MPVRVGKFTIGLILSNIIIAILLAFPWAWDAAVVQGGFFPLRIMSGEIIGNGFVIPTFLTPITAAFIHSGIMHLIFNMMILLVTGRMVESAIGYYIAFLYLVGAYGSALAELLAAPQSAIPVIGASGGISAILAAYLIYFPKHQPKGWKNIPAHIFRPLQLFIGFVMLNLLIGYTSAYTGQNIAIYGHIGGFMAGLFLARPLLNMTR